MPHIDPDEQGFDELYRIMTTSVVPRPIGWVSTTSKGGVDNIAPFSHFNTVCPYPPVVMFSIGYKDKEAKTPKDTTRNILESEEFVLNLVTESFLDRMDETSAMLESDESEFTFADLEREPSERVTPPRVKDAVVTMEGALYDTQRVYANTMILGEIELIHIDDAVMTEGKIDARKIDAVGRLGGPFYTTTEIMDDAERSY